MRRTPFLLVLAAAAALADDGPGEMRARPVAWDDAVRDVFDTSWIVPSTRTDPDADPDERPTDLAARAVELASLRFADAAEDAAADLRPRNFADLIAACRAFGADAKARDAWLARLRDARRDVWDACGAELLQLGRDEFHRGAKWKPSEDHDRDGILQGRSFVAAACGREPWTKVGVETRIQQAMTVFLADLDALKTGESDYTAYPSDVGADYEFIYAAEGSFVRGADADRRPFSALRVISRADLPFPYSHFDCDLRILNRVGADGLVRCDVYSTSPDFHYLAGQDVYVPLRTSADAFAGLLVARVYGFDLSGVPDGEGNVREALRGSLGNLKRRSEKAFADAGSKERTLRDAVPDVVVRGVRKVPASGR